MGGIRETANERVTARRARAKHPERMGSAPFITANFGLLVTDNWGGNYMNMKLSAAAICSLLLVTGCDEQSSTASTSACAARPSDANIQAVMPQAGYALVAVSDCDTNGVRTVWFASQNYAFSAELRHADNEHWYLFGEHITNGSSFVAQVQN